MIWFVSVKSSHTPQVVAFSVFTGHLKALMQISKPNFPGPENSSSSAPAIDALAKKLSLLAAGKKHQKPINISLDFRPLSDMPNSLPWWNVGEVSDFNHGSDDKSHENPLLLHQ